MIITHKSQYNDKVLVISRIMIIERVKFNTINQIIYKITHQLKRKVIKYTEYNLINSIIITPN